MNLLSDDALRKMFSLVQSRDRDDHNVVYRFYGNFNEIHNNVDECVRHILQELVDPSDFTKFIHGKFLYNDTYEFICMIQESAAATRHGWLLLPSYWRPLTFYQLTFKNNEYICRKYDLFSNIQYELI